MILVYSDSTSRHARKSWLFNVIPCRCLRASIVSCTKDGRFSTNGLSMVSTYMLTGSVRLPIPETIGRPGGADESLWILGIV
ncbi:hypothetical protein XELAEV_18012415mg [Xenopus laevis]|uniref:Uncharacterized protein n=1 Tax=Xenopus laevis TaxID=8355 RepID=A0A974DMI2_XENLA|nr:hypothetical protein XELAEV_18012415mg [Xenopus laevis]